MAETGLSASPGGPKVMVDGYCAPAFKRVQDVFTEAADKELGAGFAVVINGEVKVDLRCGFADSARTRPYAAETLTHFYSVTKLLSAVMVARLVDQGRVRYDDPITSVWPEFGAEGKDRLSIGQVMSHQAGVSGFADKIDQALWYDWHGMCAHLAAMKPLWPPGSASGYHGMTFGNLAGEIFRRVDGRTIGTAFREDVAKPFDLDLWIGLPVSEHGRLAQMEKPRALPDFGGVTPVKQATMMVPWGGPSTRDEAAYYAAEFPAANGVGTALSLARLMSTVVSGGGILSDKGVEHLRTERIRNLDLVLPFDLSWGAGVMRSGAGVDYGPGQRTFGHSGWGGSCAFGDPDLRLGCAYVMNRQQSYLANDPRAVALIKAAYESM